jgi:hypothetical protein
LKNIEPGAIKTDFYDRSMEYVSMPAYDNYISVVTENMSRQAMSAPGPEAMGLQNIPGSKRR